MEYTALSLIDQITRCGVRRWGFTAGSRTSPQMRFYCGLSTLPADEVYCGGMYQQMCLVERDGEFNRTTRDTFPQKNDLNLCYQAHREIIKFAWTALVSLNTVQCVDINSRTRLQHVIRLVAILKKKVTCKSIFDTTARNLWLCLIRVGGCNTKDNLFILNNVYI